jgi:hypothetical protein
MQKPIKSLKKINPESLERNLTLDLNFREMKYPVTKSQLLEKAKSLNALSETIKYLEACPEREYTNLSNVINDCRSQSWTLTELYNH